MSWLICEGTFQNMLCCSLPAHENIFFDFCDNVTLKYIFLSTEVSLNLSIIDVLFVLIFYVPVNIFSAMLDGSYWVDRIKCLTQGHNVAT